MGSSARRRAGCGWTEAHPWMQKLAFRSSLLDPSRRVVHLVAVHHSGQLLHLLRADLLPVHKVLRARSLSSRASTDHRMEGR